MSKVDKAKLRELAEKASGSGWELNGLEITADTRALVCCGRGGYECCGEPDVDGSADDVIATASHEDCAAFIAAANPATILTLLDEIKTLEGLYHMHRETEERQMIELRAEVAKLREIAMRLIDLQNSGRGAVQAFGLWNDVADQARQALGLEVRRG